MKPKVIVTILLILILLALLAWFARNKNFGGFFNTPTLTAISTNTPTITNTSTPTLEPIKGGWSIYHIPNYGVSFTYPTVFEKGFIYKFHEEILCGLTANEEPNEFSINIGALINIGIVETRESLDDYVNSTETNLMKEWDVKHVPFERAGFSGAKLLITEKDPPSWGYEWMEITYFTKDNFIVEIIYRDDPFFDCSKPEINYSMHEVYKQIVSTLKFERK